MQRLLVRSDPYNIKYDKQLKEELGYTKYSYKYCNSWKKFIDATAYIKCNATGKKYKTIRDTSCNSKKVVDVECFIKCMKQGVSSTRFWKPCWLN